MSGFTYLFSIAEFGRVQQQSSQWRLLVLDWQKIAWLDTEIQEEGASRTRQAWSRSNGPILLSGASYSWWQSTVATHLWRSQAACSAEWAAWCRSRGSQETCTTGFALLIGAPRARFCLTWEWHQADTVVSTWHSLSWWLLVCPFLSEALLGFLESYCCIPLRQWRADSNLPRCHQSCPLHHLQYPV